MNDSTYILNLADISIIYLSIRLRRYLYDCGPFRTAELSQSGDHRTNSAGKQDFTAESDQR